jgi:tetratricopeptide (TPR) repeat protein
MNPKDIERLWLSGRRRDALDDARTALEGPPPERLAASRVLCALASNRATPEGGEATRLCAELALSAVAAVDPPGTDLHVVEALGDEATSPALLEALRRCFDLAERIALGDASLLREIARAVGRSRDDAGHVGEAEAWLRRAVDIEFARLPAPDGLSFAPFSDLKQLLVRQARFADTAGVLWTQLQAREDRGQLPPIDFVVTFIEAGDLLRRGARLDDAEDAHRRALEAALEFFPVQGVAVADARKALAVTCLARGRRDEALRLLDEAEGALATAYRDPDHAEVADVRRLRREATGDG